MRSDPLIHRLRREPLLHFFVLGALLFALYGWLNRGALSSPGEIVVSREQMQSLQAQFQRTWQRTPLPEELQGLVESWIREEILYREGLAMGLERDDSIVRRRVAQKVEFMAEGVSPVPPTDEELQAWLDQHAEKYRVESGYSLRQVYFNPVRHGDNLKISVSAALRALQAGKPVAGDSTMLPDRLDKVPAFEVARVFGEEFRKGLDALPVGSWQGPVRSGFGMHLVELRVRDDGRRAELGEVRATVERDLLSARSAELKAAFYARLRAKYEVHIK
jgi:hypothetical protein